MIYDVFITHHAQNDMIEIYRYICFDLSECERAKVLLRKIENAIADLSVMPYRFKKHANKRWENTNLRVRSINKHYIFYIVNEEEQTVSIIRVFYSGRDINRQLHHYINT